MPYGSSTVVHAVQITTARITNSGGLIDDDVLATFEYVADLWICSVLSYLGIVSNIITIIVFVKMGFKETVNISMTSIAIWDLVKCFCAALIRIYGPIDLDSPYLSKSWKSVTLIVFGYLYTMAGYTSGAVAAYVAVERCLCVSMPFTVRYLLTRKVVTVTNIVLSIAVVGSYVVVYSLFDFFQMTDVETNRTFVAYRYNTISVQFPGILVYVNMISVFYPVVTFGITCICTIVITYHLKKASLFRAKIKATEKADGSAELSSRDRQVINMLLVIIVIYIVCFLPRIAFFIIMSVVPEFLYQKLYNNTFWVSLYIMSIFDFINSAINIFIFYSMSSYFKSTFQKIFHMHERIL